MNPHLTIRPPRYKPEYIKANRLGPIGIRRAKKRDAVLFALMQDRSGQPKTGRGQ